MRFISEAISAYLVLMIEFIFDLCTDVTVCCTPWQAAVKLGLNFLSKERLLFPYCDLQPSMEAQRLCETVAGYFEGSARQVSLGR